MAIFKKKDFEIFLVVGLIIANTICADSSVPKNPDLVFKGEVNPNAKLKETGFHRSELYSYFRLPTAASKVNDSLLTDTATPQCSYWATKYKYDRYYIEVEKNDNGYYLAWCCLKKKYESLTRTFTDINGNSQTQTESINLYTKQTVNKSTQKQNAQVINQKHIKVNKELSKIFNNIDKNLEHENVKYFEKEQQKEHKKLEQKSATMFSRLFS